MLTILSLEEIRKRLSSRNVNISEIARATGINRSHVDQIYRGLIQNPRIDTLMKISNYLLDLEKKNK